MATRSHTWFDAEKLLPGEEMVSTECAHVRTEAPPFWWDGVVVLTSQRLFFLPHISNPFLPNVAYWLSDVVDVEHAGRARVHVQTPSESTTLRLSPSRPWRWPRHVRDGWLRAIGARLGAPAVGDAAAGEPAAG